MKSMRYTGIPAVILALALFAGMAYSDFIIKPTDAVSSGTDNWDGREPFNTYNGGGFSVAEQTNLLTDAEIFEPWPAVDTGLVSIQARTWRGPIQGYPATVTLTLHPSDKYLVSGIHIWNYIEFETTGTITFNIEVSSDNSSWTAVNGGADYPIARGNSGAVLRGETFDFGQVYDDIQYVRINITDAFGYVGFDEIRLIRPAPPGGMVLIFQ